MASSEDWQAQFYYAGPVLPSTDRDGSKLVELPSFIELNTAIRHYREMASGIIQQLSISHEIALRTEKILYPPNQNTTKLLSQHLERKISKAAQLLEHNAFVLEKILKPFPVSAIEPEAADFLYKMDEENLPDEDVDSSSDLKHTIARYIPPFSAANGDNANEEKPYAEAVQIIAHLTRDWTREGAILRDEFNWIKEQLWSYHRDSMISTSESALSPILVPGAGIGRLAFDLAFEENNDCSDDYFVHYQFAVEAMDNSIVMAAAAHHLFHIHSNDNNGNITDDQIYNRGQLKIYPFVADSLSNEVDTEWRWDSAHIPEHSVLHKLSQLNDPQILQRPKLSYTIGDFVTTYSSPSKRGKYGSLVSVFFIDTATNIYEYILTIKHALKDGGVWINLGPVQWHSNSQLQPSTNELREMIEAAGFEVKHWEVSEKLVAYRHQDDLDSTYSKDRGSRSTRSEAYRPLRFVATLNTDAPSGDEQEESLLSSIQKVRLSTGRRSIVNMHHDFVEDHQDE